jgi:alpha-tubulin suppressor-like RCC1 family protein
MRRVLFFGIAVTTLVAGCLFTGALSASAKTTTRLVNSNLTQVKAVSSDAGSETTCAVLSTGAVDCWGYGANGQLGNGANSLSDSPVSTGITNAKAIADDYEGSTFCSVLSTGAVDCWGYGADGELGNGTTTASDVPVSVEDITTATAVVGGEDAFCALLSSHAIDCWGYGADGELGNGTTTNSDVPVQVSTITNASKVIGGLFYFCSLLSSKSIDCWGRNSDGQLGNGTTVDSDVPVSVTGITNAKSVMSASESMTTCAVLSTATVDCWGYNAYGQVGNGTTTNSDVPVSTGVSDAKSLAVDVATEGSAVGFCALLTTGHVECWGYNVYGEVGNGTTTESNSPVKVKKIKTASSLIGGDDGYCAVLSTHSIDCWGRGDYGELGNGSDASSDKPVAVETITNGSKLVSGYLEYCATLTTKGLDCWGYNGAGQLGNGSMTDSDTPVAVKAA